MVKKEISPNDRLLRLVHKSGGEDKLLAGEPLAVPLRKFDNNRTLTGDHTLSCCACGFKHTIVHNVFLDPDGKPWLISKFYGDESTKPRRVIRQKAKKE